ncbi:MAG TPA: type IV secretory system conjugative DNA transfer family protein [Candidatus Paceibacterota bacterium]
MDPNAITYFAETDARNKKIKFGIKAKDRLKHVYVIGKTGMGKSTLLENMAIQDIQNGNGIAFVDPHGGTAEKLLDYVPESRVKDVLYFAPFDLEYPISFNLIEDIGADKRHLVVNGLMSTFEKIWVDAWSARMAYILNNSLLALLEYPGSTLLGVNRMLSDKDYRKKVVDNVKDPSVKSFWVDEFAKYTERFAAEATPAIQNKVGQFTSNPLVRNIIGQPKSSFDLREIMDKKKILIVNLSKGRVGEGNANLIGSMLITKIYLAAMSRADSSESQLANLPNFYLYVDEFQSFANKSFADILSEARKYKLNLTIAHQYIEQMEEEVRDAVFGNVGTMITFRVGAFDSEVLEKEFAPTFEAVDLVGLGFAQVYLKLMIDGVSSQPFSATTLGPIAKPDISFKDAVITSSREQFGHPRAQVEKEIVDWHDLGTAREVRDGSAGRPRPALPPEEGVGGDNQNVKQVGERPEVQFRNEVQKEDPEATKKAFMQAAEELRKKEGEERQSQHRSVPASRAAVPEQSLIHGKQYDMRQERLKDNFNKSGNTVSLSSLKSDKDKKNPTRENMSSLKAALSSVISKPRENPQKTEIQTKYKPQPRQSEKVSTKEVPEDVLRNLLK